MPGTTSDLTLVIGIEGNPRARHDIGSNPSVRLDFGGKPHAMHNIGANPHGRNKTVTLVPRTTLELTIMSGTTLEQTLMSCLLLLIFVHGMELEVASLLEFTPHYYASYGAKVSIYNACYRLILNYYIISFKEKFDFFSLFPSQKIILI